MRYLLSLAFIAISVTGWGQLHFALEDLEVSFPPTTIDSTSYQSVVIFNSLSVPQQVTLTGIEDPFHIDEMEFEIPANDTTSITMSFTPSGVQVYNDSLFMSGTVFGGDSISIQGEGTLPVVTLAEDSLDFGDVSINSVHPLTFTVENTGVGTLLLDEIVSSSSEFSCEGNVEIPEGETAELTINFYTELASLYSTILTISTTDPYNPFVEVFVQANAISEIEGTVCGNLSTINSPYVFIEDVVVPEECTLTIDPGVVLDLNGYSLNVLGELISEGTEEDRITIQNGEVHLTQNQFITINTDFSNNSSTDVVNRENIYFENFETGNQPFYCFTDGNSWNGTSGNGDYHCDDFYNAQDATWSSNGTRSLRLASNNYDGYMYLNDAISDLSPGYYQWNLLFKSQFLEKKAYLRISYQINGNDWVSFYNSQRD